MVPALLMDRVSAAEKERRGTWASDPASPDHGGENKRVELGMK